MEILIIIAVVLGVIFWHAGLMLRMNGRMPYSFGFDIFSMLQNFIIIPTSLIHTFGFKTGGLSYVAGLILVHFVCSFLTTPILNILTKGNSYTMLTLFNLTFWGNVIILILGFIL